MNQTWVQMLSLGPSALYLVGYALYLLSNIGDGATKRLKTIQTEAETLEALPDDDDLRASLSSALKRRVDNHRWKTIRRVDSGNFAALIVFQLVLGGLIYAGTSWALAATGIFSVFLWIFVVLVVGTALLVLYAGVSQLYTDPVEGQEKQAKRQAEREARKARRRARKQ